MKYFQPKSLSEALRFISKWKGTAKFIAGGTNVLPSIRAKTIKSEILIDINHLKNLSFIKEGKNRIRIGGGTTISELTSSAIQKYAPILFEAANQLGNPLVRNRATIAGNIADASPAADMAVPLLSLEAIVLTERDGGKKRQIPIDQFFIGPNKTVLKNDEIIREISFSKPVTNTQMAYIKLGLRNAMAISVVSLAVVMEIKGNKCIKARIGLGAVAPTPMRAYRTEELLTGKELTTKLIKECSKKVLDEISPITDIRASREYRSEMVLVLLGRLVQQIVSKSRDAETILKQVQHKV